MKKPPLSVKAALGTLIPVAASITVWVAETGRYETTMYLVFVVMILSSIYGGLNFNNSVRIFGENLRTIKEMSKALNEDTSSEQKRSQDE